MLLRRNESNNYEISFGKSQIDNWTVYYHLADPGRTNKAGKIKGFKVYHGKFQNILGFILMIFRKTVLVYMDDQYGFIDCKSYKKYLKRIDRETFTDEIIRIHSHFWVTSAAKFLVNKSRENFKGQLIDEVTSPVFLLKPGRITVQSAREYTINS